ncbi:histidinol phosphate phosphatase [Clostridium fermenticellae]|uniref:Histidinol-phosphatase n=1 Tax=Clostridium fermenticellae TaxID=2068654 RepID=A0A386H3F2_9CLOT|nr:histidinol phosphate phosphatase [Clostridium fermenticellae]AYD40118.1 histidinol phosphate phosphatase [Clostridium fermenticellae]
MFDTHIHTKFSTDSDMKIEKALNDAKRKGLSLIITDHMDLKFPKKGLFCFDEKKYFEEYSKYKGNNLLIGIEIGMKEDCETESRKLINDNCFDYVIGSIHLIDDQDLYYGEYYSGKTKKQAYDKYFKTMFDCVRMYDFIDSMGHIDYISRYAKFDDKEIYYNEHANLIDSIFNVIIERDQCIELNTRRLSDKTAVKGMIPIYKRFRELGGRYITIGSDAHNVDAIGMNFKVGLEIADMCNLKIVYFKNRKREYEKY